MYDTNKIVNNMLGGMPKKDMKSKNMDYDSVLEEVATSKGLNGETKRKYKQFMKQRFPDETHATYMGEWASRFKKGPEKYMDGMSLEVYRSL